MQQKKSFDMETLVRIGLAIILVCFLGACLFGKRSEYAVDGKVPQHRQVNLADHVTGNFADIIGILLFVTGIVFLAGVGPWLGRLVAHNTGKDVSDITDPYGSKGETNKYIFVTAGLLVVGWVLFSFFSTIHMAWTILLIEVFWYLSATRDAREEKAWSFPFREFEWPGKYYQDMKKPTSEDAHRYGAESVGALALLTALLYTLMQYAGGVEVWWKIVLYFLGSFFGALLTYWWTFDIKYSKSIGLPWHYIGGTAKLDVWLVKRFGQKAGQKKGLFCILAVALIDVLMFVL